ncbi:MAG: hypothetical protein ACXVLQ_05320 [Bacteriovorax sp.]
MKKACLGLSLLSLVLTTATPVMAADLEARASLSVQANSVRNAYAQLNRGLTQANMNQKISKFTKDLVASGASVDQVIEFATADMSDYQKSQFMDSVSSITSAPLTSLSKEELTSLLAQTVKSQASGAHYSNACENAAGFLGFTAGIAGLTGFIIAMVGMGDATTAKDKINSLNSDKIAAQGEIAKINSLYKEEVRDVLIVQQENKIAQINNDLSVEQKNYDSAKNLENIGLYTLAGAGAATIGAIGFSTCAR